MSYSPTFLLNSYSGIANSGIDQLDNVTTAAGIVIIVAIVLVGISTNSKKQQPLPYSFRSLGNMAGMHKDEIIKAVGQPTNIVPVHGGELIHWVSSGYKIVIRFDAKGIFEGIQVRIH